MRDDFLLDPSVVFLNHGSFGACPRPVFADYQRWQLELERQPVEFLGRRSEALLDAARGEVARFVGADPDCLVFVPNATTGVNVVARSLKLSPGDEVLGTDLEYGACDRTWEHRCDQTGARYVRARVPLPATDPAAIVDAIWDAVTPRTNVLYLSHITSSTALKVPIETLCRRARAAGIVSVIDGAHAPGQIPIDLDAIGADAYTGNLHKWLGAPKGAGFLHVRAEHHAWTQAPIVSWGWVEGNERHRPDRLFVGRNQWQGTRDLAAFLAVPAAIRYQAEHDWPRVRERCHTLVAAARERICRRFDLPPLSVDPVNGSWRWFEQMAVAPLPKGTDGPELKRRLYDEFRIEVPITEWNGRPFVRVSVQGYNTAEDIDALLRALDRLVPPPLSAVTRRHRDQSDSAARA